jgi:hypothetical protein
VINAVQTTTSWVGLVAWAATQDPVTLSIKIPACSKPATAEPKCEFSLAAQASRCTLEALRKEVGGGRGTGPFCLALPKERNIGLTWFEVTHKVAGTGGASQPSVVESPTFDKPSYTVVQGRKVIDQNNPIQQGTNAIVRIKSKSDGREQYYFVSKGGNGSLVDGGGAKGGTSGCKEAPDKWHYVCKAVDNGLVLNWKAAETDAGDSKCRISAGNDCKGWFHITPLAGNSDAEIEEVERATRGAMCNALCLVVYIPVVAPSVPDAKDEAGNRPRMAKVEPKDGRDFVCPWRSADGEEIAGAIDCLRVKTTEIRDKWSGVCKRLETHSIYLDACGTRSKGVTGCAFYAPNFPKIMQEDESVLSELCQVDGVIGVEVPPFTRLSSDQGDWHDEDGADVLAYLVYFHNIFFEEGHNGARGVLEEIANGGVCPVPRANGHRAPQPSLLTTAGFIDTFVLSLTEKVKEMYVSMNLPPNELCGGGAVGLLPQHWVLDFVG